MQLKYVNAAADGQDIQVPAVQVEPMKNGAIYEVDKAVGALLLKSDSAHWKEVLPKDDKPAPVARQTRATVIVKKGDE